MAFNDRVWQFYGVEIVSSTAIFLIEVTPSSAKIWKQKADRNDLAQHASNEIAAIVRAYTTQEDEYCNADNPADQAKALLLQLKVHISQKYASKGHTVNSLDRLGYFPGDMEDYFDKYADTMSLGRPYFSEAKA